MYLKYLIKQVHTPRRFLLVALALALAVGSVLPFLPSKEATAAQLTSRKATINKSAVNSSDVEFAFAYSIGNTTNTKAGIIYEFCTTPLGACSLPAGMNVQTSNSHDSQSGWPTNGTAFAPVSEAADVGECTLNTNSYMICYSRDEAVATGTTGGAVTHTISGITAPSSIQSVYVRISLYTNDDFLTGNQLQSSGTDDVGTVAVAFVDQLTVNGRVQERLEFCVAGIDDDDSLPSAVSTCSALSDSNVDLGTIDNTAIQRTPVEPTATNGADDDYGIAMANTNASGGLVVSFFPEQDTGGSNEQFSFRVDNAPCDAGQPSSVDQCFIDASAAGEAFVAGTERFGMHIPCIDTTQGTTSNLGSVPGAYNNADNDTSSSADCEGTDAGNDFAWNESLTAATIASSSTIVDDEIIKLRFGATAAATTPTGSYTVVVNYIATPTF